LLLLGAGAMLVVLAGDVRATRDALDSGDAAYTLNPDAEPAWQADGLLPGPFGERILGLGGQLDLREALALYRAGRAAEEGFDQGYAAAQARGAAEATLSTIERFDNDRGRASKAANLLGILAFIDARPSEEAGGPVERAVAEFRNAIRLDPGNDDAKYNLELVLTLLAAGKLPVTQVAESGGFGPTRRGTGESPPGRGY
jgi:tetratricopeptide (TPR) repeat protein